jgi:hypothetical protein
MLSDGCRAMHPLIFSAGLARRSLSHGRGCCNFILLAISSDSHCILSYTLSNLLTLRAASAWYRTRARFHIEKSWQDVRMSSVDHVGKTQYVNIFKFSLTVETP